MSTRRVAAFRAAVVGLVLLVLLAGLGSCGLILPRAVYETTDVSLEVPVDSLSGARVISPTASPENVFLLMVTVVGEDQYGVYQDPLATAQMTLSGGVWSAAIAGLPIGPTLTFSLEAFDSAGVAIYAGSSTRVLSGGETITIALYPYDDGVSIAFPVVLFISRPAEILVSSTVAVTVGLQGGTNETLDVVFSAIAGSFTPSSVAVPLSGTHGELAVSYTAPGTPGGPAGYVQSVEVTNEQGNSVLTQFPTVVVYEVGNTTIEVGDFAPSITGLSGQREGSGVFWTAAVSDDGPAGELTHLWSYSGGLRFADPTINPAILQGYGESATGTVTLTVTDGAGLSTTVSFLLAAGQFPDSVVVVAAGGPALEAADHSVYLSRTSALSTWGLNADGQLGLGDAANRPTRSRVGLDADWGAVSASGSHTAAVRTDGTLWTWGNNSHGQLGHGDTTARLTPALLSGAPDWESIGAGGWHTLAVKNDGTLWAWGRNTYGQLGVGGTTRRLVPVRVGTGTDWRLVAGGTFHTVALRKDGTLWAWGRNNLGQLGLGDSTNRSAPVQVGPDSDWVAVTAGTYQTLALKADGSLWVWGRNTSGQLGLGDTTNRLVPTRLGAGGNSWARVGAGDRHSVGLRSDGSLWAWGRGAEGQLGTGGTAAWRSPVRVGTANNWAAVAAGNSHTIALRSDDSLWGWGYNGDGQLGLGDLVNRLSPTSVP